MYDRYQRRIDYLRISVTDRCNLRCTYCMPAGGVELRRHEDLLSYEEIAAFVRVAVGLGITRVRLTGGEPLVRRGVVSLVAMLAAIDGLERPRPDHQRHPAAGDGRRPRRRRTAPREHQPRCDRPRPLRGDSPAAATSSRRWPASRRPGRRGCCRSS